MNIVSKIVRESYYIITFNGNVSFIIANIISKVNGVVSVGRVKFIESLTVRYELTVKLF